MADETIVQKFYIYKMTCMRTGESYIGRTKRPIAREREHLTRSMSGAKLTLAMELWGADAFTFEIICKCESLEKSVALEAKMIAAHKTAWPNGFNAASGVATEPTKNTKRRKQMHIGGEIIYRITHLATGLSYIGRSKNGYKRFTMHPQSRSRSKIGQAMRLYGCRAFKFEVISVHQDHDVARAAEAQTIRSENTIWPNGFNLQNGGSGTLAKNLSKEERERRSAGLRGRKLSAEQRAKIKAAWASNREERVAAITAANRRVQAEREARGEPHPSKGKPSPFKGVKRGPYGSSRIKPDTKAKQSASHKKAFEDQDLRKRISENSLRMWADPMHKVKHRAILSALFKDPERMAKHSAELRARWADQEYKSRVSKSIRDAYARKREKKNAPLS